MPLVNLCHPVTKEKGNKLNKPYEFIFFLVQKNSLHLFAVCSLDAYNKRFK